MPDALTEVDDLSAALRALRRDATAAQQVIRELDAPPSVERYLLGHLDAEKRTLVLVDSYIRRAVRSMQLATDALEG